MNQILQTNSNNNDYNDNYINYYEDKYSKRMKFILKIQLFISLILMSVIITLNIVNIYNLNKMEKYSGKILNSYNITKLYSEENTSSVNINNINLQIIGIIEIPKLNINYTVFSYCTKELLKFSPCRIYGPLPGKSGNLCIAGHNYDNDKFFSKINNLKINDEIILYNNSSVKFSYHVSDVYEVKDNDLSPIYSYNNNFKQITLITCNNINNNRIIVKAFLQN